VQESQQELENDQDPGESGIQELENGQDQEPEIHRNMHRPLSRMAQAAAALLTSPFQRRSSSKYAGRSPSMSSTSSRSSDDESNGHAAFDLDQAEDLGDDSDLDQEEDLGDSNNQPNGHNESPAPPDLDPDLEMEEELGNYREDEGELEGTNILAMGQAVEQDDDKYKKSGIVTR
jgi:hypothetical protein